LTAQPDALLFGDRQSVGMLLVSSFRITYHGDAGEKYEVELIPDIKENRTRFAKYKSRSPLSSSVQTGNACKWTEVIEIVVAY
jgi:hypothetical protein